MPFVKSQPFKIEIWVKNDSHTQVTVEGKHFLEDKHRILLAKVGTIAVCGCVDVREISYSAPLLLQKTPGPGVSPASSTPESCPTVLHMSTNAAFGRCQRNDRTVHKPITGGLLPSKSITIKGNVLSNSNRFHINLKSGNDIAFHLNPRFDENVIVRNSFVHQTWGTEERDMPGTMPLAQGQNFTIRISCQDHCFKVAVNEQDQFEYKHRVQNLQQIDTLEITGDVTVTDVQI